MEPINTHSVPPLFTSFTPYILEKFQTLKNLKVESVESTNLRVTQAIRVLFLTLWNRADMDLPPQSKKPLKDLKPADFESSQIIWGQEETPYIATCKEKKIYSCEVNDEVYVSEAKMRDMALYSCIMKGSELDVDFQVTYLSSEMFVENPLKGRVIVNIPLRAYERIFRDALYVIRDLPAIEPEICELGPDLSYNFCGVKEKCWPQYLREEDPRAHHTDEAPGYANAIARNLQCVEQSVRVVLLALFNQRHISLAGCSEIYRPWDVDEEAHAQSSIVWGNDLRTKLGFISLHSLEKGYLCQITQARHFEEMSLYSCSIKNKNVYGSDITFNIYYEHSSSTEFEKQLDGKIRIDINFRYRKI